MRDLPIRSCDLAPKHHHCYSNFVLLLLLLLREEDGRYGREYHPASDGEEKVEDGIKGWDEADRA